MNRRSPRTPSGSPLARISSPKKNCSRTCATISRANAANFPGKKSKRTFSYTFDSPAGRITLADLFGGKSQLVIYHFMLGPEWTEAPRCSLAADGFAGSIPHLEQRDTAFAAVSRAPLAKIEEFRKRMGWNFKWVSSNGTELNYDYGVSFKPEQNGKSNPVYNYGTTAFGESEAPGLSVLARKAARCITPTQPMAVASNRCSASTICSTGRR